MRLTKLYFGVDLSSRNKGDWFLKSSVNSTAVTRRVVRQMWRFYVGGSYVGIRDTRLFSWLSLKMLKAVEFRLLTWSRRFVTIQLKLSVSSSRLPSCHQETKLKCMSYGNHYPILQRDE